MIKSKKVQRRMAHLKRVREFKKHNDYDKHVSFKEIDCQPNIHKSRTIQYKKIHDMCGAEMFYKMISPYLLDDETAQMTFHPKRRGFPNETFKWKILEIFYYVR
jgi:hypothetical protein